MLKVNTNNFVKYLGSFIGAQKKADTMAHNLAVFGMQHAFKTGDCVYMNQFFEALDSGRKAQYRRYVGVTCSVNQKDPETCWFKFENDMFSVVSKRKRVVVYRAKGEKDIILKEPEALIEHAPFFAINPDKVKDPFGNENVVQAIMRLATKTAKEDSKVDPELAAIIAATSKKVVKFSEKQAA